MRSRYAVGDRHAWDANWAGSGSWLPEARDARSVNVTSGGTQVRDAGPGRLVWRVIL
jgi:hypothetical protein